MYRYEEKCLDNQYNETYAPCNTWVNDHSICPDPCLIAECPIFSKCNVTSTDEDPGYECVCQLGTKMKDDGSACIAPPPTTPTPRPIPTLPAAQKVAANVVTRSTSTIIIVFLGYLRFVWFLLYTNLKIISV